MLSGHSQRGIEMVNNYGNDNDSVTEAYATESTYTERLDEASAYGEFNIVLDVEIYYAEGDLE